MRGGGIDDGSADRSEEPREWALDFDEFHRLLSSASRRRVLYYLQEHPETSLEELSDVLAGWKAVEANTVVGARERNRGRVSLHHVDLPQLADSGVVAYDHESREVSMNPLPEHLSRILQHAREYERERRTRETNAVRPKP